MVKSVLGVQHAGFRDWLIQRVSAVLMVIYTLGLLVFFAKHPDLSFYTWQALFAHPLMKVATLLVFTLLLFHAWVGMWTVWTDYVKCYVVRLILYVTIFLGLAACFLAALLILWGV